MARVVPKHFTKLCSKFAPNKVRWAGSKMIIIDRLENLLPCIECLEEEGIPVRGNLYLYCLRRGNILSKRVEICVSEKSAILREPEES